MADSLVIVESTAKTRTIHKILGKDYLVKASIGHIKDLPKGRLGVDVQNGFEPEYITIRGKGQTIRELRKLAAAVRDIYIATDPDREGEAIAYHLSQELKDRNRNIHRVLFNEITRDAVLKAMKHPTTIDMEKVEAQRARRVMDRLVGYQVSPLLWGALYRGLSAGRVQSVALRLICEREEEIESFVPEEFWSITAELQGKDTDPFFAKLIKINGQKPEIPNESAAQDIVNDLWKRNFVVVSVSRKDVTRKPSPPFTTSTMQQEAAKRYGFSAKQTMAIAQQLYEGVEIGEEGSVGLITYMRTDSTRIADEALQAVREYIAKAYGMDYLPDKPQRYRVKAGAQDAHEAIRPTSMEREPRKIAKYLTPEQLKLYELIWNRFVACQMKPAIYEQTTIDITADHYLFRITGSTIKFRGFLQAYEDIKEEVEAKEEEGEEAAYIPTNLKKGDPLQLLNLIPKQHFTKPPPRYSESSLVKQLDELGIGRPSTYAVIISTLLERKYVERKDRRLIPTELGRIVNRILIRYFPDIFNVKFTAIMESKLDEIESGRKSAVEVLREFYRPFSKAVARVDAIKGRIRASLEEKTDSVCPECGSPLIIRWGRNGKFRACARYPDCKFTRPLEEEEGLAGQGVQETCDVCGAPMVPKVGRFGRFLACSNYPRCTHTKPYSLGIPCPREGCPGRIVERRSRRGKIFYGCSEYPRCDFATWQKPVPQPCPNCQYPYMEERSNKSKGEFLRCPQCKAEFSLETAEVATE